MHFDILPLSSNGLIDGTWPEGVQLRSLQMHRDDRGVFTEVFRQEWNVGISPIQWNVVRSQPGVLRGVHVHQRHGDYLILAGGRASVGLRDLRPGSPTEGVVALVDMVGDALAGLTIPAGVAHGFLFHEPSLHIYAVTHYWDISDELGCHWADHNLAIPWPVVPTYISERDAALPPLRQLEGLISPWSKNIDHTSCQAA